MLNIDHIDTIPRLWEEAFRVAKPEAPFLHTLVENKVYSYKKINAEARCLAAYLVLRGIRVGDILLIVTDNHPVYFIYQLAVHLIGGVDLTVDRDTSPEQYKQLGRKYAIKGYLLPSYALYNQHKAWFDIQGIDMICRLEEGAEADTTDSIIVLDVAVECGKEYWRENLDLMRRRADNVTPDHTATIFEGDVHRRLTHRQLMQGLKDSKKLLPQSLAGSLALNFLSEAYYLQKINGFLLPLAAGYEVTYAHAFVMAPMDLRAVEPSVLVLLPGQIRSLLELLKQDFRTHYRFRSRYIEKALSLTVKINAMRDSRKSVPFFTNLSRKRLNNWVLKPFRKRYFGQVRFLITQRQGMDEQLIAICRALELPLVLMPTPVDGNT